MDPPSSPGQHPATYLVKAICAAEAGSAPSYLRQVVINSAQPYMEKAVEALDLLTPRRLTVIGSKLDSTQLGAIIAGAGAAEIVLLDRDPSGYSVGAHPTR